MKTLKNYGITIYSNFDNKIIEIASNNDLYLIGGTAIEVYCNNFRIKSNRSRSNNDIDFLSLSNNPKLINALGEITSLMKVSKVVRENNIMVNISNSKVDIDILLTIDKNINRYFNKIGNLKIMSPSYLFMSKFSRFITLDKKRYKSRYDTDKSDLIQLIHIMDKVGESEFINIEKYLKDFVEVDENIELIINELIKESN